MNLRKKDHADIRRDAISMAAKKLASGCDDCADGYLKLARDHGATEAEMAGVRPGPSRISVPEPVPASRISVVRRNIAVPTAASTGAAGLAMAPSIPAVASPPTTLEEKLMRVREHAQGFKPSKVRTDPFGVDGSTSVSAGTIYGMPLQFYIGEMGYGLCSNCGPCGGSCFNTGSANHVGIWYTYGYWGLEGPNSSDKGSRTNFQFGQAQADAFVSAWQGGPYSSYVYGQTFFADVETGFGGWSDYNYGPNQDVLNGFFYEITYWGRTYRTTFYPGVYIGKTSINGPKHYYFPTSYSLPCYDSKCPVFWVTSDQTCAPCAPCSNSCNTITDVTNRWNNSVHHDCFGGQGAVLWQYWISCCGCSGDFDYSPQSGNTYFTPVGCS